MNRSVLPAHQPLAGRLHSKNLGEGVSLRIAFGSGLPHSCILRGPAGVVKATIAPLLNQQLGKIIAQCFGFLGVDHA